jgi:hypothetical protein
MSWQEIFALTMELDEIKNILRREYGISIKGKRTVNLDSEIEDLKNLVNNIMNENSQFKKEMETMALNLDRLAEEVARVTTVHSSAMSLLRKLTVELETVSAELAAQAAQSPPVLDTAPLDALIDQLKASTDTLAGAVADSADVKHDVVEVVLNADDPTEATISVIMPEVMPEHVEITAEVVVDTVDMASEEPQVVITVTEAETPVEADAVVEVIVTPSDETVDITVEADADMHAEVLADAGVDVVEAVKEAFESTDEVVAAPVEEAPADADAPADDEPKTE